MVALALTDARLLACIYNVKKINMQGEELSDRFGLEKTLTYFKVLPNLLTMD